MERAKIQPPTAQQHGRLLHAPLQVIPPAGHGEVKEPGLPGPHLQQAKKNTGAYFGNFKKFSELCPGGLFLYPVRLHIFE